jgi:hypothetical protein
LILLIRPAGTTIPDHPTFHERLFIMMAALLCFNALPCRRAGFTPMASVAYMCALD